MRDAVVCSRGPPQTTHTPTHTYECVQVWAHHVRVAALTEVDHSSRRMRLCQQGAVRHTGSLSWCCEHMNTHTQYAAVSAARSELGSRLATSPHPLTLDTHLHAWVLKVIHCLQQGGQHCSAAAHLQVRSQVCAHLTQRLAGGPAHLRVGGQQTATMTAGQKKTTTTTTDTTAHQQTVNTGG